MDEIQNYLGQNRIPVYHDQHIAIISAENRLAALETTKNLLYHVSDKTTALFLSGGSTPKPLYEQLAKEEKLIVGAAGLIDERYGEPFHQNSNEKMIKETGLLRYFSARDIKFYSILKKQDIQETAREYDDNVRYLLFNMPKSIALLGVGEDGHTAGMAPNRIDFKNPLYEKHLETNLVSHFDDHGPFGQRVTLTFRGLSMIDILIVLVFGSSKQTAINAMFSSGNIEQVPARFYTQPDISKKTLLITDQKI